MSVSVVFPKFNLEKSSGEISNWLVEAGDQVTAGQVLFEVEDDKAAVEVDSPADGFIGGLEPSLTEIDVGAVVAHIFETKEEALAAVKDQPAAAAPTEAPSSAPTPAPNAPA
ncbi:MAG: lipoyl domain-containing protein, partial [Alphaproteobacteria bacterium]